MKNQEKKKPIYKSLLMENKDIIITQIQAVVDDRFINLIEPRLFKSTIIMTQAGPTESRMMIPWMPMIGKNPITLPVENVIAMTDLDEMGIATYISNIKACEIQTNITKKAHNEFLNNIKEYEDAVESDPDPDRLGPSEQEFLDRMSYMASGGRRGRDEYSDQDSDFVFNDDLEEAQEEDETEAPDEKEEPDYSKEFDTLADLPIDLNSDKPRSDIVDRGPRFTFDE